MSDTNLKTNDIIRCNGRTVIYDSHNYIDNTNVVKILNDALPQFMINKSQIRYLNNYRRGIQPILYREKVIRPEICNKVVVNRASEISAFKVGYLLTKPVQYVSRSADKNLSNEITKLNDYMYLADKEYYDRDLADKFSVAGTAYRFVLPAEDRNEPCPFVINDIDTENAFIIYYSGIGHKPLMGVIEVKTRNEQDEETIKYCCYTDKKYYEIANGIILKEENHALQSIPLIEYPNNSSRIGDFELVIPLLDSINIVYSNRLDGVEQFVQSLMKFINVDITPDDFEKLKDLGAIKLKSTGDGNTQDVSFITQELNQSQVQVLIDSLYDDILTICGMPNRNGGSSTSDTGSAVIMRDGWEAAESRACATELMFTRSEKKFLKIVLLIAKVFKKDALPLQNISIKFTRRNYENITQKSTVLTTMLGSNKIHPKLAFESCGLFTDPEVAYIMSENYAKQMQKIQDTLMQQEENDDKQLKEQPKEDEKQKVVVDENKPK